MIYEIRTYDLQPHSLPEVEKRFGEAYEKRKALSQLYAFWYTEIGPLNQVIHLWAYRSYEERTRCREAMRADPGWAPYLSKIHPLIVAMETKLLTPAPFFDLTPFFGKDRS